MCCGVRKTGLLRCSRRSVRVAQKWETRANPLFAQGRKIRAGVETHSRAFCILVLSFSIFLSLSFRGLAFLRVNVNFSTRFHPKISAATPSTFLPFESTKFFDRTLDSFLSFSRALSSLPRRYLFPIYTIFWKILHEGCLGPFDPVHQLRALFSLSLSSPSFSIVRVRRTENDRWDFRASHTLGRRTRRPKFSIFFSLSASKDYGTRSHTRKEREWSKKCGLFIEIHEIRVEFLLFFFFFHQ